MSDFLALAYAAMPGLAEAEQGLDAIKDRITHLRQHMPRANHLVNRDVMDEILQGVRDGQPLPADLGRRLVDDYSQSARHHAETEVLQGALSILTADLGTLKQQGADQALARLSEELDGILTEAAQLNRTLAQVRTTDDVINGTDQQAAAWRRLVQLLGNYRNLRLAQRTITLGGIHGYAHGADTNEADSLLRTAGEMPDLITVWPRWDDEQQRSFPGQPAPWPDDSDPTKQLYSLDYLRWASVTHHRIWLPTLPQLHEAAARHKRLAEEREINAAKAKGLYRPASQRNTSSLYR